PICLSSTPAGCSWGRCAPSASRWPCACWRWCCCTSSSAAWRCCWSAAWGRLHPGLGVLCHHGGVVPDTGIPGFVYRFL
ncbi:unnamed protein product, partial [Ilex paraguariensis]